MTNLTIGIRRRLLAQRGEVSSWLLIAAGLAMAAAVAASILSSTVTQLASSVSAAAQVQTAGATGPAADAATAPVATTNTGGALVDWDAVEGATRYRVLRNGEPILEAATTSFVDNSGSTFNSNSDGAVYEVEALDVFNNVLGDTPAARISEMRFGFPEPGETTVKDITVYTEDVRGPGTITQSTALDGSTYELTETNVDTEDQYSDRKETFPDGTTQHITVVNGVVVNNYSTDIFGNPLPGGLFEGEIVPEPPPPPPSTVGNGSSGGGDGGGGPTTGQGSNSLTGADGGKEVCGSCAGSGGGGYDNPDLDGHPSAAG